MSRKPSLPDLAQGLNTRLERLNKRIRTSPSLASTDVERRPDFAYRKAVDPDGDTDPRRRRRRDPDEDLLPGSVIVTADEPLRADVRGIADDVALLLAVTARLAVETAPSILLILLILCASALVGASTALVIVTVYLWSLP